MPAGKKAFFTIERSVDAGNEFKTMHLLVHRNLTLRYKLDINMAAKTSISSEIMLNDLSTGIVQFTLFNANWIPVAERIIFVNNHSHSFYPQIFLIKKDLSKRGLNKIIISVPDTLLTITSVAVTEAVLADRDGPTIFSDFLLSDEIRGKVNNANYYFSSDIQFDSLTRNDKLTDSALAAHLDLVMLTHGHRRYNWEQIANGVMPPIQYTADTSYIQIKGQVTAGRLHHFKEPLSLNMVLFTKDSAKNIFTVPVQSDGSFEKSHLFYYDTAKLYYSLIAAKKIKGVVKFNNNFLSGEERKNFFKNITNEVQKNNFPMTDKNSLSVTSEIFYRELNKRLDFKAGTTLKEVKVKVRLKTAKQVLDEYYTSGFYSGEGNNYMIDVEGDITSSRYRDIFAYLQTKIPGLNVVYNYNAGPIPLWYPNSQGIPDVPAFLLDEVPVSLESVRSIDVNSIAFVKAFRPPFLGSLLNGFSGVIVLYSKRGYSPLYNNENSIAGLETHLLPGYTLFKEFTQPVYPDLATTTEEDYRPTLYWNPFIIIDKNNPQFEISFYNNDISKKLCVVLEGINIEGKMTRIVKMLE